MLSFVFWTDIKCSDIYPVQQLSSVMYLALAICVCVINEASIPWAVRRSGLENAYSRTLFSLSKVRLTLVFGVQSGFIRTFVWCQTLQVFVF